MKGLKVGLVRHFKVVRGYPNTLVTSAELMKWVGEYDASDVVENEIDLCNIEWKRCFSSDLPRAEKTARKAFQGSIVYLSELREITLSPFVRWNIRIPLFVHLLSIRVAWLLNHRSQQEGKQAVFNRINAALDQILLHDEDVLIVGHGGIMMFMRQELLRRGFAGPKFRRAENGKLYVFEK